MSGWIKMGVHLRTHPKVVRMATALRADRLRVVGGLWAVWCIFDAHTDDGLLCGYTLQAIDDDLGWKGFAAAMQSIGWLEESDGGLLAPQYNEHNGPSAKRRASETKRKAESRIDAGDVRTKSERVADNAKKKSGQMSASDADKKRAREEKIREEPIHSEAKASGAAAPPPEVSPMSAKERVWALGVPLLGDSARSLLGKLAKAHTDDVLVSVLAEATLERPIDPKAWVIAACEARAKRPKPANGSHVETMEEIFANPRPEWAVVAGFHDRFQAENAGCTAKTAHLYREGQRTAA